MHQEGASQPVPQLKHNLLFTGVCWCQKNPTLVFITLNSIGHVMWLNWGIRWLWVQVIVHSIGEGSGHTLHVNNQAMIILLVPLSKGKMFWGCWPIWRRVKIPLFISTCSSCSPFGSNPPPQIFSCSSSANLHVEHSNIEHLKWWRHKRWVVFVV